MDVTCDRCGTDYEFEEALVSTRGTTVKCTQCGHLFKIYKPQAPGEASKEQHPWTVRAADGSSHRLSSLADLTRLIGEGVFSRNDEVSRTGKAWKKLGEIDELKGFFPDSERPPARTRRQTGTPELGLRQPSVPSAAPMGPGPALPRGVSSIPPATPEGSERRRTTTKPLRFESMGSTVDLDGPSAAAEPRNSAAPSTATSPGIAPAPGASIKTAPVVSVKPGPATAGPVPNESADPSGPRRRSNTDEKPLHSLPPRQSQPPPPPAPRVAAPIAAQQPAPSPGPSKRSPWPWLVPLLVLVAGAVATALLWPQLAERLAAKPALDPTAEFVARADAAFATHRIQHFEDASTEYVKALAYHEFDPHILSSISRVYAVWAQELRLKMDALSAGSTARDVEHRSEVVALEKEARQLAEQAKRYAETAARKNPGNEEAEVALSDALRLSGNLVAARSELDRANATSTTPNAETLRVATLLTIDEAKGDLRAGLKLASQAVAQEPDLIRTRLLLARCLVADGDIPAARYHLNAVSVRDRSHPGVVAVEQEIERRSKPPTSSDTRTAADAGQPIAKPDPPAPEDLSHEGYIGRGQALLEQGQVLQAKRMFEQALFIRPSSAKAHTGLGYVALEKGRPQLAVEHFQPAARQGNSAALIGLGDAYRRLKKPREALKAYQGYLAREPSGAHANIARTQVERLSEELDASRA
jgi:predicted Zn finger-like uncharacterized protein